MSPSGGASSAVAELVEPGDHRLHAAVHVDAVVGVADGRVQLGQVLAVLGIAAA